MSERPQAATKAQGKPPIKAEGVYTLQEKVTQVVTVLNLNIYTLYFSWE